MPAPDSRDRRPQQPKVLLGLLLAAGFAVVTIDARDPAHSPLGPAREAVAAVAGPAETATAALVRPFTRVPDYLDSTRTLQSEIASLEAQNAQLRGQLSSTGLQRRQVEEVAGLLAKAGETGYDLLPARVVAMGSAQSFTHTVTIDAGRSSGVHADMTVVNNDGLVGRVISATRSTAVVLLVSDRDSVVGARLGSNQEVGFLRGRGDLGSGGRLDLDLVDDTVTPTRDDVVVTWGSSQGTPYVAGVPIGHVTQVVSTPRQLAQHAVIEPFVDFSSLDLVGVVVPEGTTGDRAVIDARGESKR